MRRSAFPPQPWLGVAGRVAELCPKAPGWTKVVAAALRLPPKQAEVAREFLSTVGVLVCINCPLAQFCGGWRS